MSRPSDCWWDVWGEEMRIMTMNEGALRLRADWALLLGCSFEKRQRGSGQADGEVRKERERAPCVQTRSGQVRTGGLD